jgi:hypothetical protein
MSRPAVRRRSATFLDDAVIVGGDDTGWIVRPTARHPPKFRVGRRVSLSTYDSGSHSAVVDGKTYYILQETGSGFPPGSGLEHKNPVHAAPRRYCFMEAHPGQEWW